jgi:DNA modification methylase
MSLSEIIERCVKEHELFKKSEASADFFLSDEVGNNAENVLALGDNVEFMRWLLHKKSMAEKFNFIYLDPPFFSGSNYSAEIKLTSEKLKLKKIKTKAYKDTWQSGMEGFLTMLTQRLLLMKDLLAPDGSIVLHMDWHAVHYVKIIMDEIFGEKNFVNEIIWNYKSGGVSRRSFAKKHDTLLYYAKSRHYYFSPQKEKSYNRGYKPYRFKGVKEFKDENGWYTMVNKRDVFNLNMVGRTSSERTGYATQKPEKLIELLLESCTKEGDLCGDFFAGSGTLPAVAEKMGRCFIACDNSSLAVATTRKRLYSQDAEFNCLETVEKHKSRKVSIKAKLCMDETAPGEFLCSAELLAYKRDINELPIATENKQALKNLQKADSLALVDYWCVDNHYDGTSFHAHSLMLRKSTIMPSETTFLVKAGNVVAIKVYDVFGGCGIFTQSV